MFEVTAFGSDDHVGVTIAETTTALGGEDAFDELFADAAAAADTVAIVAVAVVIGDTAVVGLGDVVTIDEGFV